MQGDTTQEADRVRLLELSRRFASSASRLAKFLKGRAGLLFEVPRLKKNCRISLTRSKTKRSLLAGQIGFAFANGSIDRNPVATKWAIIFRIRVQGDSGKCI